MARPLIKRFYHAYRRSTLVSVRAREQRTARALRREAFFDEAYYAGRYPEVAGSGLDAISHYCRWGHAAGYSPHPLFDPLHYSSQYPDLPASGGRRLLHFLGQGRTSLATPHPLFDSAFYLEQSGPLVLPDESALLHYLREGEELGYWPHPFFDPSHYEASNPDLWSSPCKLAHFATDGGQEGRSPCWLFDPAWYRVQCPESELAQRSPLTHYQQAGDQAGLSPHPLFDPAHYSLQYPDIPRREGLRLRHYMLQGAFDGSSPHPLFDGGWYQRENSGALDPGMNPLRHFLERGQKEGLDPSPDFSFAAYFQKYPELDQRRVNPLVDHVIREAKGARSGNISTGPPSDQENNRGTFRLFWLSIFRNFIRYQKTTNGGERALPSGPMSRKRSPATRATNNHSSLQNSGSMTFGYRKYARARLLSPRNMASEAFVITTIGSREERSWRDPLKKSWPAGSPIFHSVSAGRMKTGLGVGMGWRMTSSCDKNIR